jgi:putative ABC transport system substrate-binding protein
MPTVGYLDLGSPELNVLAAFRKGLSETGFVEGRNVAIEYRFALNEYDRLPDLAADLVRRRVAVIVTSHTSVALAAKAATSAIPIVFFSGGTDPVEAGLVASFNRPGGNVTGIASISSELRPKRFELLHELVPQASRIAFIVNPNALDSAVVIARVQAAAAVLGKQVENSARRHQRRDRCGLCQACAEPRRSGHGHQPHLVYQPPRPTHYAGGAPRLAGNVFRP